MIIKRQKSFANAAKIVSDEMIKKKLSKEVASITEYLKKHPMKFVKH